MRWASRLNLEEMYKFTLPFHISAIQSNDSMSICEAASHILEMPNKLTHIGKIGTAEPFPTRMCQVL